LIALGIAGGRLVGEYYRRAFGDVFPAKPMSAGEMYFMKPGFSWTDVPLKARLPGAIGFTAIYAIALITLGPRWPLAVVPVTIAAYAAGMDVYLWRSHTLRARLHWVVGMAIVAAVTVILAAPIPTFASLHTVSGVWTFVGISFALIGLAYIINGLLDHRLLVRSLALVARASSASRQRG
jgi:hypothetical protein